MEEKPTIRIHLKGVPSDLHRAVKVAAAEDGKSMKAWIEEAMAAFLKSREN